MDKRPVMQKMKHTNPPMTKAERDYRFNALSRMGCIVCRMRGVYTMPIIHHLCGAETTRKGSGGKADDRETIPLCPPHHQFHGAGLSYHDAPAIWEQKFGTQYHFLALTNKLIEELP